MVAAIGDENIFRLGSNVDILACNLAIGVYRGFNGSQSKGFLILGRSRDGHVTCGTDSCPFSHSDRRFQLYACPVAGGAAVSHSCQHNFPAVTGFLQGKIPHKTRVCRGNIDQTGKVQAVLCYDAGTTLQVDIAAPQACPIHRIDFTRNFDGSIGIQGNGAILNLAPVLGEGRVIHAAIAHQDIVLRLGRCHKVYAARIDDTGRAYHHAIRGEKIEIAPNAAVLHRIDRAADTGLIIDKVYQTACIRTARSSAHMHIGNIPCIQFKIFESIDSDRIHQFICIDIVDRVVELRTADFFNILRRSQ